MPRGNARRRRGTAGRAAPTRNPSADWDEIDDGFDDDYDDHYNDDDRSYQDGPDRRSAGGGINPIVLGAAVVSILLVAGAVIWGVVALSSNQAPEQIADNNDPAEVDDQEPEDTNTRTTNTAIAHPRRNSSAGDGGPATNSGTAMATQTDSGVSNVPEGGNQTVTAQNPGTTGTVETTSRPAVNPPATTTGQATPQLERPISGGRTLTRVSPKIIGQTPISPADISDILMSPDGKYIVIQNILQPIRYWERGVGFTWLEYKGHSRGNHLCGISPDSEMAITSGGNETHVWDLATGETRTAIKARSECGVLSEDGSRLALLKYGDVFLYSTENGRELGRLKLGYVGQTMMLGDGDKTMISIGSMHDVAVHDTNGNRLQHWKVEGGGFSNGHISSDGSRALVLHSSDASVLDLHTGKILPYWKENISSSDGAISGDGRIVAISNSTELRIIDLSDPDDPKWMQFIYPKRAFHRAQIAISGDGTLLVSTISNQKVGEIWDLKAMISEAHNGE